MVYLGIRPRGSSPRISRPGSGDVRIRRVLAGRLAPARRADSPKATGLAGERLDGATLALSWVSPGRFPGDVLRHDGGSWLLTATTNDRAADDLSFVGRRQEQLYATVTATVRVADAVGGLSVRIDGRHHLDMEVDGGAVRAVVQIGEIRAVLGELAADAGTDVALQLRMVPAPGSVFSATLGPDRVVAGVVGAEGLSGLVSSTVGTSRPSWPAASPAGWSGSTAVKGLSRSGPTIIWPTNQRHCDRRKNSHVQQSRHPRVAPSLGLPGGQTTSSWLQAHSTSGRDPIHHYTDLVN